jgi:L-Ala-D/L-Glu epimerase
VPVDRVPIERVPIEPVPVEPVPVEPADPDPVLVDQVSVTVVRPLRHAVLRPGRPPEESVYREDLEPDSVHVAARAGGAVLAVGTAIHEEPPWDPANANAWRVRGMATAEERRGRGLGTRVLAVLVGAVADAGATLVWCNARVPARRLYERAGFTTRGTAFDIPVIGPHIVMWRAVGVCQPIGVVAPGTPGDAR